MELHHRHSPIDPFNLEGLPSRLITGEQWRRQPSDRASFLRSLAHARDGVMHALATQRNFRIQAVCGLAVLVLALWLRMPAHQLMLIVALTALVLCAELVNTAIEATLDECVGVAFDPAVKRIKDTAAAAVAIVCIGAAVLGTAIFLPALVARIT